MKQQQFEAEYSSFWRAMEGSLEHLERRASGTPDIAPEHFPAACRRLAHHLALARQRGYSPALLRHLNELMLRAHRQLYRRPPAVGDRVRGLLLDDFPRAVRVQWRWHLAATACLALSALLLFLLILDRPEMVHAVLDDQTLAEMEQMYDRPQTARTGEDDLLMFGFYIHNNIGIAFRTFAGGLLLGVGALFIMLVNGGFLGAVSAHMVHIEATEAFFTFVVAHAAPELVAICLAGGAGLQLGAAIVAPGRHARLHALRGAARRTLPVIAGVVVLLVLAAFIEAFWSPRPLAAEIKYAAGALCWFVVISFLLLGGRRAH